MKRFLSLIQVLIIVILLLSSCALKRDDMKSGVWNGGAARSETFMLAEEAVRALVDQGAFGPVEVTMEHKYNTAKWIAPGITELETKEDSSIALIEVYEKNLTEFRSFDIDTYFEITILDKNTAEHKDLLTRGGKLLRTRNVIEALLSYDVYYDRLSADDLTRMMKDFSEFDSVYYDSAVKYDNDWEHKILFERYRAEQKAT